MGTIQEKKVGCSKCGSVDNQIKKGKTPCGSQRLFCKICGNKYTPIKKGHSEEVKKMAVKAYLSGNSARKVGRMFGMDGNTVMSWVIFFQSKSGVQQSKQILQK